MVAIDPSIKKLVDAEKGTMSPRIFSDPDLYEQELDQIFDRSWLFVGHESQIPNPGDFILSRMGQENVILTRDRQGKIHVALNACRHRGNLVCRYDSGHAFAFQCTFHGWVYDSSGALVTLPKVDGAFTTNSAGSGAFQWDKADTQKGSRWVFTKNPTYWDADSVYLDKIRFLIIRDVATQQAAFQTHQLDIISTSDGNVVSEIARANPSALAVDYFDYTRYLITHHEKPPLDDGRIRKAISLAIDRDAFVKVNGGKGRWGVVATGLWVDALPRKRSSRPTPTTSPRPSALWQTQVTLTALKSSYCTT